MELTYGKHLFFIGFFIFLRFYLFIDFLLSIKANIIKLRKFMMKRV
jgi:hypothetical protein